MDAPDEVTFDVDGRRVALSEPEARRLAERLRGFATGRYAGDVGSLAEHGTDPEWLAGALALADAIEDVLTTTRTGAIPLDAQGKAADAALAALALTGPVSFDATGGLSRLHATLQETRS